MHRHSLSHAMPKALSQGGGRHTCMRRYNSAFQTEVCACVCNLQPLSNHLMPLQNHCPPSLIDHTHARQFTAPQLLAFERNDLNNT